MKPFRRDDGYGLGRCGGHKSGWRAPLSPPPDVVPVIFSAQEIYWENPRISR